MNSMPEPTNPSTRINDSAGFRDGYAEGFLDAVELKQNVSPETASLIAGLAARRDTLSPATRTVIRDMFGASPADCPEWCVVDHAEDDPRDDIVLHTGDDHTDGTVRKLLDAQRLDIRVTSTTSTLPDEPDTTPTLNVRVDVELKTWEQAAELARAILDGFGYLMGA
jgi:hypothetical protein